MPDITPIDRALSNSLERISMPLKYKIMEIIRVINTQSLIGKADKVTGATDGNLASLDSDGDLTDSGISADEVLEPEDILGTTNQITITDNLDGTITISIPQNIDTNADVEFDTVKLGDLTPGQVAFPGATNILTGDSSLFWDNTNKRLGVGTSSPQTDFHAKNTSATAVIRTERGSTVLTYDSIVGRWEVVTNDADAAGVCAKIEAICEGSSGETGWRFSGGVAGALIEFMRMTNTGEIGIGTTEPDADLHVEKAAGAVQRMTRKDTSPTADAIIGRVEFETQDSDSSGVAAYVQAIVEGTGGEVGLAFATGTGSGATERVRITNAGVFNLSGPVTPCQLSDAAAPNDSIYYSTTASKLVYKDSGGIVNALY